MDDLANATLCSEVFEPIRLDVSTLISRQSKGNMVLMRLISAKQKRGLEASEYGWITPLH